jgi:flagellum-specific ATP synthase
MLEAEGLDLALGASARIQAVDGRKMRGEVVGFRGSKTLLVPLDGAAPYRAGSRIEPDAEAGRVACGKALLGRIIGAHGEPLDGRGPILARDSWPLHGPVSNPLNRGRVVRPLDLGVRAVNGLLTAGEGQRIAIIAGSGVGKSVLMGQMLAGSECDVVVIGLVGERAREVTDFIETRLSASMMPRAVVVAVPADHPPLLRLRAAMRATAIAEHFRHEGKRVLLLIDSLTRVAHAQREIGLALGEPPTMKGYPPSALGLIPGLVERAGRDVRSGSTPCWPMAATMMTLSSIPRVPLPMGTSSCPALCLNKMSSPLSTSANRCRASWLTLPMPIICARRPASASSGPPMRRIVISS